MDFVKGQLVRSKAGRDKNRTLAVLAVDGPMLWLADGKAINHSGMPSPPTRRTVQTDGTLQGGNQLV